MPPAELVNVYTAIPSIKYWMQWYVGGQQCFIMLDAGGSTASCCEGVHLDVCLRRHCRGSTAPAAGVRAAHRSDENGGGGPPWLVAWTGPAAAAAWLCPHPSTWVTH